MPRITRVYTRSGDDGTTGLGGGQRVPKDSARIAAYGLGTLAEVFDGDPPHTPRGCIAQAWTVGEVLRAWCEIAQTA